MAAISSTLLSSEVMSAFDKKIALVANDVWPDEIDFSKTFGPYVIPKWTSAAGRFLTMHDIAKSTYHGVREM